MRATTGWCLWIVYLCSVTVALRFDVPSTTVASKPLCVRDFVNEGQLVVVEVHTDGSENDGQSLNLSIRDTYGNEYQQKKGILGKVRVAFTASRSAAFDVCFENTAKTKKSGALFRSVELEIESGSEARDWNKLAAAQQLKPVELELRKIEEVTDEITEELEYLKLREARRRDTNESTNSRVLNFSVLVILTLTGLGAWQVNYLRYYFAAKHII